MFIYKSEKIRLCCCCFSSALGERASDAILSDFDNLNILDAFIERVFVSAHR